MVTTSNTLNFDNCVTSASNIAQPFTSTNYTFTIPNTNMDYGAYINSSNLHIDGISLYDYINNVVEKTEKVKKDLNKEKDIMKMFNFDFGPANSDIALSMRGMAVRNSEGRFVSYDFDKDEIVDVDAFTIESRTSLFYKMPVALKDVAIGDIIIHNKHYCFVIDTIVDGNVLNVVDITNGSIQSIYPTKSPFGFNFVTKIVSLVDYKNANADCPFGNILPLIMMQNGDMNEVLPFLMMNGNTSFKDMDPMMLMCLFGSDKKDNLFPWVMMMQNKK